MSGEAQCVACGRRFATFTDLDHHDCVQPSRRERRQVRKILQRLDETHPQNQRPGTWGLTP